MKYKTFLTFHLPYTVFVISSRYTSAEGIQYAKFELIKHVQFQLFSSLIKICSSKNTTLKEKECLHFIGKLQLMVVDGVLRVGDRLKRAHVQYGNKHFVILPNNFPLIDLFIHRYHLEIDHSGVEHMYIITSTLLDH